MRFGQRAWSQTVCKRRLWISRAVKWLALPLGTLRFNQRGRAAGERELSALLGKPAVAPEGLWHSEFGSSMTHSRLLGFPPFAIPKRLSLVNLGHKGNNTTCGTA